MTNNLPSVYYYTEANALYYWSGDDLIFDGDGRYPLFKNRTNSEVKTFLLDFIAIFKQLGMTPDYNYIINTVKYQFIYLFVL